MKYQRMEFATGKHSITGMGYATSHARATKELVLAHREMVKK